VADRLGAPFDRAENRTRDAVMLAVLRGSEADTSRIKVEEWERAIRVPNVQLESLARILRIHPVSAP
jgi:hypothetical protein